jgi:general stress protein 26
MSEARADALAFLKQHTAGVLSTVSADGKAHGSAIYYVTDDDFNIYFITLKTSRKFANLQENPSVALTVGRQDVPQTIQLEGVASALQHPDDIGAHAADLMKVLTSNSRYYAPLTQLGSADTAIIWIQPKWVRWADYANAETEKKSVLIEIPV